MSGDSSVTAKLVDLEPGTAAISAVTYAEIRFGLQKMSLASMSRNRQQQMARKEELFDRLLDQLDVLAWNKDAAAAYAVERIDCEKDGETLDRGDLMILAH